MATEIWGKGREHLARTRAALTPSSARSTGRARRLRRAAQSADEEGDDPAEVAEEIEKALTASSPDDRYLVGAGAGTAVFLQKVLPAAVFDRVKERLVTPGA